MSDFDNYDLKRFMPQAKKCPKCGTRMDSSGKLINFSYITSYVCSKCGYNEEVVGQ